MPYADSLIKRDDADHQKRGSKQVWIIVATGGTQIKIGFDQEFVKKHLFVDPKPGTDANAKATKIVTATNLYGNLTGSEERTVSASLDADTLRFLKLQKLVYSRKSQNTCSVCHQGIGLHLDLCTVCKHAHKNYTRGKVCQDCGCDVIDKRTRGGNASNAKDCAGYVKNDYALHRDDLGLHNPFEESGGRISSMNSVVLMSIIDLQRFKDAIVAGIQSQTWTDNKIVDEVPFTFGPNTVAVIKNTDNLAAFNGRPKGKGMKAKVHYGSDHIYRFNHWVGMID